MLLHTVVGTRFHHVRLLVHPERAAYLNLIEPWWKHLRSLAFSGQCFTSWEQVGEVVEKATDYWNAHRHPFVWGRRRRHQVRRAPSIALVAAHP